MTCAPHGISAQSDPEETSSDSNPTPSVRIQGNKTPEVRALKHPAPSHPPVWIDGVTDNEKALLAFFQSDHRRRVEKTRQRMRVAAGVVFSIIVGRMRVSRVCPRPLDGHVVVLSVRPS